MLDNPNKILEKPLNLLKTTKNNMEKIAHFMWSYLTKLTPSAGKEVLIILDQVQICVILDAKDAVVNQLLTNLDGVDALNNVIVIGMTNRKDLLD